MGYTESGKFWSRKSRAAVVAVLAVALLCCGAFASAATIGHKTASTARKPIAETHASRLPELIAHPLLMTQLAAGDPSALAKFAGKTNAPAGATRKRRSRFVAPFIYTAAVDGDYVYTIQTTKRLSRRQLYNSVLPAPTKLVRTQVSTGAKTTLLTAERSMLYGLTAGHGRVALTVIRETEHGREKYDVDTQVMSALHTDPKLTVVDAHSGKVDENRDTFCGSARVLAGLSDEQEYLELAVDRDCAAKSQISAKLVGIAQDGHERVLKPRIDEQSAFSSLNMAKNLLLESNNFYGGGVEALDVTTGETRKYWAQTYGVRLDQADDGSLALAPQGIGFYEFFDEPETTRGSEGLLVIFPQGDQNKPRIASRTAGRTLALKFCGAHLFELRTRGRGEYDYYDPEVLLSGALGVKIKSEVIERNPDGAFVKSLGVTPKISIKGYGCNGESLVLATATRTKLTSRTYAP